MSEEGNCDSKQYNKLPNLSIFYLREKIKRRDLKATAAFVQIQVLQVKYLESFR